MLVAVVGGGVRGRKGTSDSPGSLLAEVFLLQASGQTDPGSSFVLCWLTSMNLSFLFSKAGACACVLSCFSHVQLCVTPWTVAHQDPLSMGLSRQEYGSRCIMVENACSLVPWLLGQIQLQNACALSGTVQFSCSVVSDSCVATPPQHNRPPCPSPTPRVYSNPCLLSR